MRNTENFLNIIVSQGRQMHQPGGNGYCVHHPHQAAEPFLIPEDIGEIRQFAPDIMIGDAQVIPIFMPPGKDVEVSSTSTDLSFVQPGTLLQQRKFSGPLLLALIRISLQNREFSLIIVNVGGAGASRVGCDPGKGRHAGV